MSAVPLERCIFHKAQTRPPIALNPLFRRVCARRDRHTHAHAKKKTHTVITVISSITCISMMKSTRLRFITTDCVLMGSVVFKHSWWLTFAFQRLLMAGLWGHKSTPGHKLMTWAQMKEYESFWIRKSCWRLILVSSKSLITAHHEVGCWIIDSNAGFLTILLSFCGCVCLYDVHCFYDVHKYVFFINFFILEYFMTY